MGRGYSHPSLTGCRAGWGLAADRKEGRELFFESKVLDF